MMKSSSSVARLRLFVLASSVAIFIGCNIFHSYSLNQFATMYDNPVYRWRIACYRPFPHARKAASWLSGLSLNKGLFGATWAWPHCWRSRPLAYGG